LIDVAITTSNVHVMLFQAVREGYAFKSKHLMMDWHPQSKPCTPTTPKAPLSSAGSRPGTSKGAGSRIGSPLVLEDAEENSRDDDPLEGEDLVGGPGSYAIDDNDEVSTNC
jgi:hypothetical protein